MCKKIKDFFFPKLCIEKQIENERRITIIYFGVAVLFFILFLIIGVPFAQMYQRGTFTLPMTQKMYDIVAFEACMGALVAVSCLTTGVSAFWGLWHYTQSLELRIKKLEQKSDR